MNLIIVESPTKAKTLSRFLGDEYIVEATVGHIKDLPKSKLGVDIEHNFAAQYEQMPKKEKYIKAMVSAAKKASHIYVASDPDREGEAIASHVKEILEEKLAKKGEKSKKTIDRITFHEITQHAVEEAIANPHKIDTNLVDAQIARRVLDRLVGYNLSPLLWRKVRRGLSAGRVQSVAVRLIVEREREIESFKPVEYWEIYVDLKNGEQFRVMLSKKDDKKIEIHDKAIADEVVSALKVSQYKVTDVKKREVKKHAYPPFTTSTMTQAGARLLGWSSKRTMQMAQALYEQGKITYHRTDSTNIAISAANAARTYIEKTYGKEFVPEKPNFYKVKAKVAQEAHEAIRPTHMETTTVEDATQNKLYQLIWKRFISSQMTPSIYDETVIEVQATTQNPTTYTLRTGGRVMKFEGFRKAYGGTDPEDDEQRLPQIEKGKDLTYVGIDPQQKFTEPPPRYNEASIIKTLEKLGIGRPSTYATIISTIQSRAYVEKKDARFFATPVGVAVNDFLTKNSTSSKRTMANEDFIGCRTLYILK
jgi:DNA topoisomerase-1